MRSGCGSHTQQIYARVGGAPSEETSDEHSSRNNSQSGSVGSTGSRSNLFPVGRQRAKGQQWPPGPAAWRRADGLGAVTRFLQHNPANPQWFNRDRFALSAGHAPDPTGRTDPGP
jgi:hypothetical protein